MNTNTFKILLLCFLALSSLKAQSVIFKAGFNGSIWAGEAFSDLEADAPAGLSRPVKAGFQLEALVDYPITNKLSLSPGLRFNQITLSLSAQEAFGRSQTTLSLQQSAGLLELPLKFRYTSSLKGRLKGYLSAGGYLGAWLYTNYDRRGVFKGEVQSESGRKRASTYVPNIGLETEAGIEYEGLLIGLGYKYGGISSEHWNFTQILCFNIGFRIE